MTTGLFRIFQILSAASFLMGAALASAGTNPFNGSFENATVPSSVDSDGDGTTAASTTGEGPSTVGRLTAVAWSEVYPWDGTTLCGPTHIVLRFRFVDLVSRASDGSRLFSRLNSGTVCFDFTTGMYDFEIHFDIAGGTGRFAGATGSFVSRGHREDPFSSGLEAVAGRYTGTLTTP